MMALTLTVPLLLGTALATEAAEAPVRTCVDTKIVTKVLDEGQVAAGVRLEWDAPFAAGELTTASFAANGYSVVGLYVSEDGAWNHAETAGRYVFLVFEDPADIGAGTRNTLQCKDGGNVLRDLTGRHPVLLRQEPLFRQGAYPHGNRQMHGVFRNGGRLHHPIPAVHSRWLGG